MLLQNPYSASTGTFHNDEQERQELKCEPHDECGKNKHPALKPQQITVWPALNLSPSSNEALGRLSLANTT
jgi:hypothetical protein